MPRSPTRTANPATAHLKAQKKASIKKNKSTVAAQRAERLSKRDPARLERQIAALRAADAERPGGLAERDRKMLATLEREVGAIRKLRGESGTGGGDGAGARVGAREEQRLRRARRDGARGTGGAGEGDGGGSAGETDDEVRRIPMPRDTPPPVPRQDIKDGGGKRRGEKVAPQVTYSSAPVMRDLKGASTSARFAPAQVRRNMGLASGKGGLVEEEEWERLERAGYVKAAEGQDMGRVGNGDENGNGPGQMRNDKAVETTKDVGDPARVTIEEIMDEDA